MSIHRMATEGAHMAQRLAVNLLAATSSHMPEGDRISRMTEAFANWSALCRKMSELEDAAPRTSNAGRDIDDNLRAFLEAKRAHR